jgi:hypothetical protein
MVGTCGKDCDCSPRSASAGPISGALDLKKANPLALSLKQLESAGPKSLIQFDIAPGLHVVATRTKFEHRGRGRFSWIGTTEHGGMIVITSTRGGVIGTIVEGNRTFRVVQLKGVLHAVRVPVPKKLRVPNAATQKHGVRPTSPKKYRGPIELIVAYTAAAATACSDIHLHIDIDTLIQHAVDDTNAVATNSRVKVSFHLASTYPTNYSEASRDMHQLVDDFKKAPDVKQRRHKSKADIAVLFVHPDDNTYAGMSAITTADYGTAFSVVDCAMVLDYYTMAHEIGHLLGLNDDTDLPDMSTFKDGYGLAHDSDDGNGWRTVMSSGWRTAMSSGCEHDCAPIPYWSNPGVSYDGIPTGVIGTSEDTRAIEYMMGIISQFE